MSKSLRSPLDHPVLSGGLFYPWTNPFKDPFYVQCDGFHLGCRYRKISSDAPTIIHFHGNGETVADYVGEFEEKIVALGANLFLAEYRGYGMSSGSPALVSMLADVGKIVTASRNDDLLDVNHAERLFEWANEPKQLII